MSVTILLIPGPVAFPACNIDKLGVADISLGSSEDVGVGDIGRSY